MKLLELFSGTRSVGTVAKSFGWTVVSLDLKNADINCNIMDWDYKQYPVGYFDFYGLVHRAQNTALQKQSVKGSLVKQKNSKENNRDNRILQP